MKRILGGVLGVFLVLALAGCGGGGSSGPAEITTQIFSDPVFDGDIAQDPLSGTLTVTQGNTQSVFAGVNPVSDVEYRAFLDFPLTGIGGVPGNAIIVSATLDIFINRIDSSSSTIPINIDLVSFQPPTLVGSDFSLTIQRALLTKTITLFPTDAGRHVFIDVTTLMKETQRLGLADLQLRILEDLNAAPARIEINDTTGANSSTLAPLLEVTYF
jgi:hypothetical protein